MNERVVPRRTVITVALISEAVLLIMAWAWTRLRGTALVLDFAPAAVFQGILAAGPMLIANFIIFRFVARHQKWAVYRQFLDEVVCPVVGDLTVLTGLLIACCAGIGEEFFFRGALNPELIGLATPAGGIALGSYLFAHIHFLGFFKRYWPLVLLYTLFGLYLSVLAFHWEELSRVIICHVFYDFVAIVYIRYCEVPRWLKSPSLSTIAK